MATAIPFVEINYSSVGEKAPERCEAGLPEAFRLAGDVQDCVGFVGLLLQLLDRLLRWQDQKFNFAALSFALHFLHDRQCSSAGADHEASALPGFSSLS